MLSKELMGLLALGILWVNTLLIAGAAYKELAALAARRRRLVDLGDRDEGEGLLRARVVRGSGPGGALAVHRIEQIGRAAAGEGARAILFNDRSAAGEIFGGVAERAPGGAPIEVEPSDRAEIWLPPADLDRAAACASDEAFDRAFADARKAKGFARTVEAAAPVEVYLFGLLRPKGKGLALGPPREGALLVAAFDPRPWLGRKMALVTAFILGEIALSAACTAAALHPPRFGLVSTLGGAACLVFFLLAQPAGTAVRDRVLVPSRTFLRGRWQRSAPIAEASPEARRAA
jgi:hypothetical protein